MSVPPPLTAHGKNCAVTRAGSMQAHSNHGNGTRQPPDSRVDPRLQSASPLPPHQLPSLCSCTGSACSCSTAGRSTGRLTPAASQAVPHRSLHACCCRHSHLRLASRGALPHAHAARGARLRGLHGAVHHHRVRSCRLAGPSRGLSARHPTPFATQATASLCRQGCVHLIGGCGRHAARRPAVPGVRL